jgi:hypothetical protein
MSRKAKLAFAAALLAFACLLWWWGRSYFDNQLHVYAVNGRLIVINIDASDAEYRDSIIERGPRRAWNGFGYYTKSQMHFAGLEYRSGYFGDSGIGVFREPRHFMLLACPIWPLALFAAALVVGSFLRVRRVCARRSRNLCTQCGYDLRATPDRCPECGATPQVSDLR